MKESIKHTEADKKRQDKPEHTTRKVLFVISITLKASVKHGARHLERDNDGKNSEPGVIKRV